MSDTLIETIEHKGYKIEVHSDFDPQNPRKEWDNAGHMVCWHRRYDLGDEMPKDSPDEWLRDQLEDATKPDSFNNKHDEMGIGELLAEFRKTHLVLPLWLYDHSGITISTRSYLGRAQHAEWDSGQVGWIYISHEEIIKQWGGKRMSPRKLLKAEQCLQGEVQVYDNYLTGEVYGFIIKDPDGEQGDSCWGFYGSQGKADMIAECRSMIDSLAADREAAEYAKIPDAAIAE